MKIDQTTLKALASAAFEAGQKILEIREAGFQTRRKADQSYVTDADHAAEEILEKRLQTIAPGIPIIGEEGFADGRHVPAGERFFLLDPLDGTREFVAGRDEFTVNIGLIDKHQPVLGVIFAPASGELFVADGQASWLVDGADWHRLEPIAVQRALPIAVTSRSFYKGRSENLLNQLAVIERIGVGSSLKFARLAQGQADIYPRHGRIMEWDTAAGHAILNAVGGQVMDFAGKPLVYGKSDAKDPFAHDGFIAFGCQKLADTYLSHMNLR